MSGHKTRAWSWALSWHACARGYSGWRARSGAPQSTPLWLGDSPCSGSGYSQRVAAGLMQQMAFTPVTTQSRL